METRIMARFNAGTPLLASMDRLEEERFKKKHAKLIKDLLKECHFDRDELESILLIFHLIKKKIAPTDIGINRQQLQDILHSAFDMTDTESTERVINAIDKHAGVIIEMRFWAKMLSLFLRGSFQERAYHCFKVYEDRGTGFITKETMMRLLRHSIISGRDDESEEAIKDFIGILCSKIDVDRDGKVNYNDFYASVTKQPLLLECMGQCLPSRAAVLTFLNTFTSYVGKM